MRQSILANVTHFTTHTLYCDAWHSHWVCLTLSISICATFLPSCLPACIAVTKSFECEVPRPPFELHLAPYVSPPCSCTILTIWSNQLYS